MRKYLSIFGLFGKMSFCKIFVCFVILSVFQLSIYFVNFSEALILEETFTLLYPISFLACLVLVCKLLISSSNHSEKTAYTVQRLQTSEKAFFHIQTVYNAVILFTLFALQSILLFVMCNYYISHSAAELTSEMSLFLAFYRVDFLHSVLPLDDTLVVFGNIFLIIGLSFACAVFSYKGRRGKFSYSIIIFLALVCVTFTRGIGNVSNDITFHVAALIVTGKALFTVYMQEEENEENY